MSSPNRLIGCLIVTAVIVSLSFSSCTNRQVLVLPAPLLQQNVAYSVDEETFVFVESEGCVYTPKMTGVHSVEYYQDTTKFWIGVRFTDYGNGNEVCLDSRFPAFIIEGIEPALYLRENYEFIHEYIENSIRVNNFQGMMMAVQICHNGKRYKATIPLTSGPVVDSTANYAYVSVYENSTDCRLHRERMLEVHLKYNGTIHGVDSEKDSILITIADAQYLQPY